MLWDWKYTRRKYSKKHKYVAAKQYATKPPLDHWKDQRGNKYLKTNENENIMFQNVWDAAKAVLREIFIAIQSYLKK